MATASSAQREPSMEEILASIRRIIEDSDGGRKQPGDTDELSQDLERASADPVPDVEAFRADLHAAPEVRKPITLAEVQAQLPVAEPGIARVETPVRPDPAPAKPSMTLAEVSARVAAEPATVEAPATANTPTPRPVNAPDAPVADWRREIAAVGEQAKVVSDRAEARKPVAQPPVDNPVAEPIIQPASEPSRPDVVRPIATSDAPRPAIVSEHTGRQVAAAFGELSDAFASRSKKTFDEMAEEMLRPMLQDWLDNNLPTLVEKLVREEIERVARGAQ
jgi:cell pole-organizing protein PopZ